MLFLSASLGWLGWRLLAQDQQLSTQRLAEQRDTAADLAVATLENRLASIEQDLSRMLLSSDGGSTPPAAGAILIQFLPGSLRTWPENGLLYYPELPEEIEARGALFGAADELEFKAHDYAGAIGALRGPAGSNDAKVRAAALIRVARNHLKAGQEQEALKTYASLFNEGATTVGGMPAALAASAGILAVLEQQKDQASLLAAAHSLQRDLNSGRWPISFATYQYLSEEAKRWLPEADRGASPRAALAEGAQWLWENRGSSHSGRFSLEMSSGPVLVVWRTSGTSLAGFVADSECIDKQWIAGIQPLLDARKVRVVLGNSNRSDGRPAIRLASATQLPWTLQVFNLDDAGSALRSRRALLVAGMGVLLALILTGAWFIGHTVARELAVARLQSDFVSAVSHEFRTPLTTLCQLSELLMRGRVADEPDRQQYYELLHKESHRLRRLVEALLNFGRLEAGKMHFRFEELDAADLVRESAAEFADGPQARGHRFEMQLEAESPRVQADRETLRCVFWNLFENAVKYSPDCDTVWVELGRHGVQVEIAVRDRGVGIPRGEQRQIFEKFVRGAAARHSDIRGTGIGLAMARQIVRAHGGDITVESEPGKGSTFRVLLPMTAHD
jgi:signal transduction histidine kinase